MIYTEHNDAGAFLAVAGPALERHEAANGLMLGIGLRLVREPNAYGSRPYLATVESESGLRVAALMTPPHKLQVFSEDDPEWAGVGLLADALRRGHWPVPGVIARQAVAQAFASIWCRRTGAACRAGMRQGVYELRQVVHPTYPAGEFRQAVADEIELVRRWARGFHEDCFGDGRQEQSLKTAEEQVKGGNLFLWVDGGPASMAARTRPTPHGQAVSYVYTPPDRRRKGYATAVVARLSQTILDDGKQFCALYTNLDDPTSNSIYRRIGYTLVADVVDTHFQEKAV
jgi:hypothetical protein